VRVGDEHADIGQYAKVGMGRLRDFIVFSHDADRLNSIFSAVCCGQD